MRPGLPLGVALAVAVAVAAAGGCEPRMAETAIFVEAFRVAPAPAPDRLLVTWLDAKQVLLRDQVVPESGSLPADREPLATVAFEIADPGPDLERRVLLLGLRGDQIVCRGYERLAVQPGAWVTRAVPLTAEAVRDGDNDGMPDEIDNCAGSSDFVGCPTVQAP